MLHGQVAHIALAREAAGVEGSLELAAEVADRGLDHAVDVVHEAPPAISPLAEMPFRPNSRSSQRPDSVSLCGCAFARGSSGDPTRARCTVVRSEERRGGRGGW